MIVMQSIGLPIFKIKQMLVDQRIVDFLIKVGIKASIKQLTERELLNCFLPGVLLHAGSLLIDPSADAGDVLHDAGHLAIFPKVIRPYCSQPTISEPETMLRILRANNIKPTEKDLSALQYCYDDQGPQGWQYAASVNLELDTMTGFNTGFDTDQEGIDIHDSIKASIGSFLGHRTSVTLYYLGMLKSKAAFPQMLKWTNDNN